MSLDRLGGLLGARTAVLAEHLGFDLRQQQEEDDDESASDPEEGSDFSYDATISEQDEEVRPVPTDVPSVPSCSYLMPGRTFTGHQRLSGAAHRRQEDWAVTATIYSCDLAAGRVTGSMVAQQSGGGGGAAAAGGDGAAAGGSGGGGGGGGGRKAIVTYFEGDIIDNLNHTFFTGAKWGLAGGAPGRDSDLHHWGRCPGFSGRMREQARRCEGRSSLLATSGHVFMRWKECFFVDVPQDCPLTITGFYYLALCRATGAITGFYHDSRSTPLQVLQLLPVETAAAAAAEGACGGPGEGAARTGPSSGRAAGAGAEAGATTAGGWGAREAGCSGMAFGTYSLC
ncbi:hypothetical protein CHLRE_17g744497v5 [Chlamydomonas reinhardtii]|uniref:Uncharacterized protein n=1 Tax=Chlamydomonas reinhardtii TaxID=3055 RepID=A0A2K3CRY8_CHLRE|nr:uncharacterized protein CHLRE_17g744497v5 [Chlamydomonas reinhardtii]PNW71052.1 hypothetical protein CHLRE_17g744497v5 [Chlamydomonas reinhardtii]